MVAATLATDANWIDFAAKEGGPVIGTYRQVSRTVWKEDSPVHGRDQFEFVETERGPGTVVLYDAPRNVTLRINLKRRIIFYDDDGKVFRPLYTITSVSTKPTGWLATTLEYGTGPGAVQGMFFQTDAAQWAEQSPDGKTRFSFAETARDDWSVYLYDASRDTHVQLDLFRGKVLVGQGSTKPVDFYSIVTSSTGVTGYLVNQVDFTAGSITIAGTYRMSGAKTWVEDSVTDGLSKFEFRETQRDDWSVYLQDESRGVALQLDLFTRKIFYSDASTPRREQYSIAHADIQPRIGIENGRTVTWVEIGDSAGTVSGALRQKNADTWAEYSKASGKDVFHFHETARDLWSVYLYDSSRNYAVQIDLFKGKVFYSNDTTSQTELYSVLNASSKLNGWLVNTVSLGDGQNKLGGLRQTGWTSWIEVARDGSSVFDFEETGRDDTSVTLLDASRGIQLRIDLNAHKVYDAGGGTTTWSELYSVASFGRDPELWALRNRITSRSAMTEDYVMDPGVRQPRAVPVYRTSVTLPPFTTFVDVWASEDATLQINEATYTVDAVRSVRVRPSSLSRVTISTAATDLHCPQILLRTNLMKPDETHVILPDVEVHKKIVGLKPNALNGARQHLGLPASLSSTDVDDLQTSLQNVARIPQYSYNYTKNGVLRDRAVLPANMSDPHFMLDFSSGGARYTPLNKQEVLQHTQGARLLQAGAAQSFLDDVGNYFKQAGQIIVHTAVAVGGDVVDTVKSVGSAAVTTVDGAGEALVHGDFLEAGKDLIEGGENVGQALVTGVTTTGGDLVDGVGQIAVITLKLGSDALQFVIDHTGVVGKAIGWLLEKAGAEIGKAIGWLLDKIGWPDVLHTHDVIRDSLNRQLDDVVNFITDLKAKSDKFFAQLGDQISNDIDRVIGLIEPAGLSQPRPPSDSHSGAIEKVEWLLGKLMHYGSGTGTKLAALTSSDPQSPMEGFALLMQKELGADKVQEAFGDGFAHLQHAFTDGSQTAQDLLVAMLDLLKGTALIALDVVSKIVDAVLDLVAGIFVALKSLINETWDIPFVSDFYEGMTSRPMTILSITSLIIAVPTTLIYQSLFDKAPFAAQGAALTLTPLSDFQHTMGVLYGGCHIMQWPFAAFASFSTYNDFKQSRADFAGAGGGPAPSLNQPSSGDIELSNRGPAPPIRNDIEPLPTPPKKADLTVANVALRLISLLAGFGELWVGLPIVPGEPKAFPLESAKLDVFKAPDYWAAVIYFYCWGGWAFAVLTSVGVSMAEGMKAKQANVDIAGDAIAGFTGYMGIVQMALASVLDHADRNKRGALAYLDTPDFQALDRAPNRRTAAQNLEDYAKRLGNHTPEIPVANMRDDEVAGWLDTLKNYYEWAKDLSPGQPLPNKGFANVMDSFPSISQFGMMPSVIDATDGISVIVSMLFDMLGHLGEAGAYIDNARKDALL